MLRKTLPIRDAGYRMRDRVLSRPKPSEAVTSRHIPNKWLSFSGRVVRFRFDLKSELKYALGSRISRIPGRFLVKMPCVFRTLAEKRNLRLTVAAHDSFARFGPASGVGAVLRARVSRILAN